MKRPLNGIAIALAAIVVIVLASMSMFVVDPTEQALVLRFGQPIRDLIGAPGLYFAPSIDPDSNHAHLLERDSPERHSLCLRLGRRHE